MISFHADKEVAGVKGWFWIDTDHGAWDGPKMDWENDHFPNIMRYVTNFDTVVQAGGNLGMYPRLLSNGFNRVITFEPDHFNYQALVANCRDQENVIKIQAALGSAAGSCAMVRPSMQNVGMHHIQLTNGNGSTNIPVLPLDYMELSGVGLIMFDLEGFEEEAVKGAEQTIRINKPVIFLERPTDQVKSFLETTLDYIPVDNSAMDVIFISRNN